MMIVLAGACFADLSTPRDGKKGVRGAALSRVAALAPENAQAIEELLRRTKSSGTVRVIVGLRISPGSEETLERRIHAAQQALLAELAHTPHKILRLYASIPAAALEATHEALLVLRVSPHVLRVDEDAVAKPF